MSLRLFIAINLPPEERRAAFDAAAPLRLGDSPVKWVPAENLHVTMRFLGQVDEPRASEIGDALAAAVAGVRAFDLGLSGCGAFPDSAHPRVIWIGVERHPALELLANDIEGVVGRFGFEPELRPFSPHVTLGRVKDHAPKDALTAVGERLRAVEYATVIPVESVDLMQSRTGGEGARYTVMKRAMLKGNGA